jgi:hypothetical protein
MKLETVREDMIIIAKLSMPVIMATPVDFLNVFLYKHMTTFVNV